MVVVERTNAFVGLTGLPQVDVSADDIDNAVGVLDLLDQCSPVVGQRAPADRSEWILSERKAPKLERAFRSYQGNYSKLLREAIPVSSALLRPVVRSPDKPAKRKQPREWYGSSCK